MAKYVGALDQGTTSTRFMIFDHGGQVVGIDQKEHEQIYPKPGWVEHDPAEIWDALPGGHQRRAREGRASRRRTSPPSASPTSVRRRSSGTGPRARRSTTRSSGRTPGPTRSSTSSPRDGGQDRLRPKVGLPLATYFSGPKVKWILDNVAGARAKAEAGDLLFGNIDTWCIWNLTGGVNGGVHVTDVSNASRTMLMDLQTLDWDDEILSADGHPALDAAGDQGLVRGLRHGRRRRWPASRSPATSATSRPPCSARPASPRARRRTPTAPAASCS